MTSAIFEAILGLLLLVLFVAKFLNFGPLNKVNIIWESIGSRAKFVKKWWFNLMFFGMAIVLISAPLTQSKASKLGIDRSEYSKLESDGRLYGLTAEQYFEEVKKAKELGFDNAASFIESKKMGIDNAVDYASAKKLNAKNKTELQNHLDEMRKRGINSIDEYVSIVVKESQARKEKELANENNKSTWISLCSKHATAKEACATASNVQKCIDVKIGQRTANMGQSYCDGPTPRWSLPTPNWSLMGD
jgi:hypothetical protein